MVPTRKVIFLSIANQILFSLSINIALIVLSTNVEFYLLYVTQIEVSCNTEFTYDCFPATTKYLKLSAL